jgi:hypothetical protein
MNLKKLVFISILCLSQLAFSEERLGQARLFLGLTKATPTELNTELTAQGLKNVDSNAQAGLEITFPVIPYVNLGLRYTKRWASEDEQTSTTNAYKANISQDVADLIARGSIFKSDILRIDAVIGAGGSNTKYDIKTASQDGSLEKKGTPFATVHALAGVSLAVGKDKFYFIVEAGYEMNKVDGFTQSGTINNNVSKIDLSGTYATVGLMFDGIPIFNK